MGQRYGMIALKSSMSTIKHHSSADLAILPTFNKCSHPHYRGAERINTDSISKRESNHVFTYLWFLSPYDD